MPSKSKNKGKSFEREVANFLSKTYSDSFTRVPDSGAFTGGKNAFRREILSEGQVRAHKGDVIPPDDWRFFNVECKNYADFAFHLLLTTGTISILEQWLTQLLQAEDKGDCSNLIFKITRKGTFIGFRLPSDFITDRFIDYTDKDNNRWRITEFYEFFRLNKESYKQKCISGTSNN